MAACTSCGKNYHIDCHKPPIKPGASKDFKCASCTALIRNDGSQKRPRKRPRVEQYESPLPPPVNPSVHSGITRNSDGHIVVTKREAIKILRCQNPNDHRLHALLDRYVNKTATRDEREVVKIKITNAARELINRPLGSHARDASPPASSRRSSISFTGNVSKSNPFKQRDKSQTPQLTNQNGQQTDLAHSESKLDKSNPPKTKDSTTKSTQTDNITSSNADVSNVDNLIVPVVIDLTAEDDVKDPTLSVTHSLAEAEISQTLKFKQLKADHDALISRNMELQQRIKELEQSKQSNRDTIEELQEQTSSLISRLMLTQRELKSSQAIETSLPPENSHLALPLKNSQGDYPIAILSPESDVQSGILPIPASDDSNREESQHQATLDAQKWKIYEQQQNIKRLERELEQVKAGKRVQMAPVAHTHLVRGMPLGINEVFLGKQPPKSNKLSRKQALSKVNLHRAGDLHTKLQVEPLRWNARDQGDRFRPKLDYLEAATLNSPATSDSDSDASNEDRMEIDDTSSHIDNSKLDKSVTAEASDQFEIPNSSNEPSGTSQEAECSRPSNNATKRLQEAEETGTEQAPPKHRPTPEAVKAAKAFERAFELDPDAMPVVADSRLAFRTGNAERSGRTRATQNDLYRVGRDVVGEMR